MEPTARARILIVEDEAKIVRVLARFLEWSGYEVHSEGCGAAALRYAAHHRPDLVILDLRLPDLPGHEVCRELRWRYPQWTLPIMMLTAMDTTEDHADGLAAGADAYVTKPFEPPELLSTISYLLGKIDPLEREKDSPRPDDLPPEE